MTESNQLKEMSPCMGGQGSGTIMAPQEIFEQEPKPYLELIDWSLLVGKQASEAESTIRQTRPDLNVIVLKEVLYFVMVMMILDDDYDSI
jgi:hypothetical protein